MTTSVAAWIIAGVILAGSWIALAHVVGGLW